MEIVKEVNQYSESYESLPNKKDMNSLRYSVPTFYKHNNSPKERHYEMPIHYLGVEEAKSHFKYLPERIIDKSWTYQTGRVRSIQYLWYLDLDKAYEDDTKELDLRKRLNHVEVDWSKLSMWNGIDDETHINLPPFKFEKITSTKLIFKEDNPQVEEFGCFSNPIPTEKRKMGRKYYKREDGNWKPITKKRGWVEVAAKSYWWKNLPDGWNITEFEEVKSKTRRGKLKFKKRLEKENIETQYFKPEREYYYLEGYASWLSQINIVPKNAELALKKASFNSRYTKTDEGYIFPQLAATPLIDFAIDHSVEDTFQLGRHFIPNSEYVKGDPYNNGSRVDYLHSSTTRNLYELFTIPPLFSLNSCECGAFYMAYDAIHDEDVCPMCGLVQEKTHYLPHEPEKFDPCSFYVNEVLEEVRPKVRKETDTTLVRVICKSCFKPSKVPFNQKEVSRCERCGGRFMGVGVVQSQDIHDEHRPEKGEGDATDLNNKDLEEDDSNKDVKKGKIKRDPINLNKSYKRKGLPEGKNDARGENWIKQHEAQIKENKNIPDKKRKGYHDQLEFHSAYKDKNGNFCHTGENKHGRIKGKMEILEDEMYAVGLDPSSDKWLYQLAVDVIKRVKLTKLFPGKDDNKVIRGVLYYVIEKYFPDFELNFVRKSSKRGSGVSVKEFSIIKNNMGRWNLEVELERHNKSLKLHETVS